MEGSPPRNMTAIKIAASKIYLGLVSDNPLSKNRSIRGSQITELSVVGRFIMDTIYPLNIKVIAATREEEILSFQCLHKEKVKSPARKTWAIRKRLKAKSNLNM